MFFVALLVDGALAGTVYALIALAFVVVYKASRMINFALGEWVMFGSLLVATGLHALGLPLAGALGVACAGMIGFARLFNRLVLRRLVGRPLVAAIMVTLGLGMLMRGVADLAFRGVPRGIALPIPAQTLSVHDILLRSDRLMAAGVAAAGVGIVAWLFHRTRTGLALRAIADDQSVALSVGIDVQRHFGITWATVGVISVLAGSVWTVVSGGGFGLVLLGLRVFPIVIIGGLDSIGGTIVGAIVVGVLESLAAGYLDPALGGGFSNIASYLVLITILCVRPHGIFGRPLVERI